MFRLEKGLSPARGKANATCPRRWGALSKENSGCPAKSHPKILSKAIPSRSAGSLALLARPKSKLSGYGASCSLGLRALLLATANVLDRAPGGDAPEGLIGAALSGLSAMMV